MVTADTVHPPLSAKRSVLPLMRGESRGWRNVLHGEHAGHYEKTDGMHYLVGSRAKYIWYSQTGHEQLFDLVDDPCELHDLSRSADAETRLAPWRRQLVAELGGRPEGCTDGERLISDRPHEQLVPKQENV